MWCFSCDSHPFSPSSPSSPPLLFSFFSDVKSNPLSLSNDFGWIRIQKKKRRSETRRTRSDCKRGSSKMLCNPLKSCCLKFAWRRRFFALIEKEGEIGFSLSSFLPFIPLSLSLMHLYWIHKYMISSWDASSLSCVSELSSPWYYPLFMLWR